MSDGCLDTPSGPPGASGGLRCRDDLAPRPGVSCGAIGLRTRMMRLCAGDEYITRIGTSPHSSPAMSREPRLCRARSSVAPPFIRWAAPSRGAGLFCCCKATDILRSIRVIVRHPREVALTAVPERGAVTVRGVRIRGPGRCRGGAGVPLAGKPPVRRLLLIRSFTVNVKASAADSRRPHQGRASGSSGALRQAGRNPSQ